MSDTMTSSQTWTAPRSELHVVIDKRNNRTYRKEHLQGTLRRANSSLQKVKIESIRSIADATTAMAAEVGDDARKEISEIAQDVITYSLSEVHKASEKIVELEKEIAAVSVEIDAINLTIEDMQKHPQPVA
jgi:hypothetical protein